MRDQPKSNKTRSLEESFRNSLEKDLGEFKNNYVDLILNFSNLSPREFINFNEKIKEIINSMTSKKQPITSTKMRKIYFRIKNSKDLNELLLQIPYLAYMVGREKKETREDLGKIYILFKDSIEKVEKEEQIDNIKKFAEVLVAYQKFFEEDKKGGDNE